MSLENRCVFDTNVIVSALLFEQSVPGKAFYAALELGEMLVSQATFTELGEVLARKKFDRYLARDDREHFLAKFLRKARLMDHDSTRPGLVLPQAPGGTPTLAL